MLETSACKILSRRFCDPDELSVALNYRRHVQITQLGPQPAHYDLILLELGAAEFLFITTDCPLRIRGPKATGFLDFAFVVQPGSKELIAHNATVAPDTIFGFDSHRENNLVLPANLILGVLQIKREVFQDCLHIMDRSDIDDRFLTSNYLRSPATLAAVQIYVRELYGLVQQQATCLRLAQLSRLILEDFVPLLIESMPSTLNHNIMADRLLCRAQLVQQAEAYMLAHLEQPITLKDLCGILKTSSRPLNYGFQEMFGTSPMAYLKWLRLHAVHRILKAADPATTKIEEIANRYGFWSAGHFGQDYKTMFGQLPSQTLKR